MLFTDLEQLAVDRLTNDAWFNAVPVLGLNLHANPFGQLDEASASLGIGAVVSVDLIRRGEKGDIATPEGIVTLVLRAKEIPLKNRRTAPYKTAFGVGVKAMSLWGNRWPADAGVWMPFDFQRLQITKLDEATGVIEWTLSMETRTYLGTNVNVLANGSGDILVNESGQPMMISPTDP